MKRLKFIPLIVISGLFSGCSPDLIVNSFVQTGNPTVNAQNNIELPVRVVVKNRGNTGAGTFKVCVEYTRDGQTYVVAFTVPNQSDIWYPHTSGTLAASETVTFEGILTILSSNHGETITLKATADCCSGDEFKPDYCRVYESNETNNGSSLITVSLP